MTESNGYVAATSEGYEIRVVDQRLDEETNKWIRIDAEGREWVDDDTSGGETQLRPFTDADKDEVGTSTPNEPEESPRVEAVVDGEHEQTTDPLKFGEVDRLKEGIATPGPNDTQVVHDGATAELPADATEEEIAGAQPDDGETA
jgi:hypothetical protein